jgi:AhpD family alkylhydroperoxidase
VAAAPSLPHPAQAGAFAQYQRAVNAAGALDQRSKKLMALALSVSHRCGECILANANGARAAGASEAEIAEAVDLGVAFGGAPAMMFYKQVQGQQP